MIAVYNILYLANMIWIILTFLFYTYQRTHAESENDFKRLIDCY